MEVGLLLLILGISLTTNAVNPGCECLMYSGTYGKEYGKFCSPDHPKPYPPSINCLLYTFIAAPEEIIEISFKEFDIKKTHPECLAGDFLKVFLHLERPEVNEYTPWVGLLCGSVPDIPKVLYSSGPALILEFHTEATPTNSTGFLGSFRFLDKRMFNIDGQKVGDTVCDYQFVSTNNSIRHGKFYSPRYPSSYPNNVRCAYRFTARPFERIRIVFDEVSLQQGDVSCLNRADVIKVHDGRSAVSPVIKVLCNEMTGVEILSTSHALYIEFLSGSQWPGQGFKATYQFQPLTPELKATSTALLDFGPAVSATTLNCDMSATSDLVRNGTVTSPGYPGSYPPKSTCRYEFQARGKQRVQISFTDFHLYHPGDDQDCDGTDSVTAFVKIDGRLDKIDVFCGTTLPRPIMSNGPSLLLQFQGIFSSRLHRGFKLDYVFTENFGITSGHQLAEYPCAFRFRSEDGLTGEFNSPNHPGYYPRDTECHYFFYGATGHKVRINFLQFDVEGVVPCELTSASDYVEFSNFMAQDRKFHRYCGQHKGFTVQSDRKFFRVTFRSNDRLDGTGFRATYQFIMDPELAKAKNQIPQQPIIFDAAQSQFVFTHQYLTLFILLMLVGLH